MQKIYAAVVMETDLGERVFFVGEDELELAMTTLVRHFPDLAASHATMYELPGKLAELLGVEKGGATEWPVGTVVFLTE
ncbi:MAG: hypothetical protein JWL62_3869 [Hyphomicrobiales bacterium]|nr:hypothetical protein [Hyphomicrobiales bacterium]